MMRRLDERETEKLLAVLELFVQSVIPLKDRISVLEEKNAELERVIATLYEGNVTVDEDSGEG